MSIDLNDPELAARLLADPKGRLPLRVFEAYVMREFTFSKTISGIQIDSRSLDMLDWTKPDIEPEEARLKAKLLLFISPPDKERDEQLSDLINAMSPPKRGRPAIKRQLALRAWVLHKFTKANWQHIAEVLLPQSATPDEIAAIMDRLKSDVRKLAHKIDKNTKS